jgi:hypothetical protein
VLACTLNLESESIHGQQVHARDHATDTWMVRNRQWQIVAGQVLRVIPNHTGCSQFPD